MENRPVWYVTYGSNMCRARFECYLTGGRPPGSQRSYIGCSDPTPPKADQPCALEGELYFAGASRVWHGGGVLFFRPPGEKGTGARALYGRRYLLTFGQLRDIAAQESNVEEVPDIDLVTLERDRCQKLGPTWYGGLHFLGQHKDAPLVTVSSYDHGMERNLPHTNYVEMLVQGLVETHKLSPGAAESYLREVTGTLPIRTG